MFDKKAIDAYKAITAPDSLKQRILDLEDSKQITKTQPLIRKYKMAYALAGIFSVLLLNIFIIGSYNETSIMLDTNKTTPNPISAYDSNPRIISESESIVLPLKLKTHKTAVVKVSVGYLLGNDGTSKEEKEVSKSNEIIWIIDKPLDMSNAEISVTANGKDKIYVLSYEDTQNTWILIKKQN